MKKYLSFVVWILLSANAFSDELIKDPIDDFLTLPFKDRYTDASAVVDVHRISMDLDGDGIDEQFIGHNMMWWGSSRGWYGAFYKPTFKGFIRLSSQNEAIGIDFQDGERSLVYVGWLAEIGAQGMLILEPVLEHVPGDPGQLLPYARFSDSKFYSIENERLVIDDHGAFDLKTAEGKAFYEHYFGKGVKSRSIKFADYPVEKLKEMGYKIPDWTKPPESLVSPILNPSVAQSAPTKTTMPPVLVQKTTPKPSPTSTAAVDTKPASDFPIISIIIIVVVGIIVGVVVFLTRRKSD